MDAAAFRRIALGMEEAVEAAHMGHPDFRVRNRIFATLHADLAFGMVRLPPDQQQRFVHEQPESFTPENGAWGRGGCTRVRLASVDEDALGEAITLAWRNAMTAVVASSKPRRPSKPRSSAKPVRRRRQS